MLPAWRAAPLPIYLLYPYASYYPARLRKFMEMMKEVMPRILAAAGGGLTPFSAWLSYRRCGRENDRGSCDRAAAASAAPHREAAVNFAIPNHHAIDADLIDPPVPGIRVTEARSSPKVFSSSCAIQPARSNQLHCEQ